MAEKEHMYRQIAQGNRVFAYADELQKHKLNLEQRIFGQASPRPL